MQGFVAAWAAALSQQTGAWLPVWGETHQKRDVRT